MTVGLKPYRGGAKWAVATLRPAPVPASGIPPTALVPGCAAAAAPRPLSVTTAGFAAGVAAAQEAGTDMPPTDAALPTAPAALPTAPESACGTASTALAAPSAACATPSVAALAAWGAKPCDRPWMSLNAVVKSRVGEINRMNASKGELASKICDPVRPSKRSPNGPLNCSPSPSEFKPIPPSENAGVDWALFVDPASDDNVWGT